jgi:hypothetical protein
MTESELKPCPFCGSRAKYANNPFEGSNTMALCISCGAEAYWRKWQSRTHPPEYARLIEAAEAVEAEIGRSVTRGNSPGHGHQIDGVWDDDSSNGRNAGKPCEWCAQWHEFAAALAAIKETQP